MKKLFTFGAIALCTLAAFGCKQELKVEVEPGESKGLTEIYATREAHNTKTTWDDANNPVKIVWGANDCISVFTTDDPSENKNQYFYSDAEGYSAYAKGGYQSLTFTHGSAEVPGTAPYWSVFPYDRSNVLVDGHIQIPFKYNQSASARLFDGKAFAAASYSEDMHFNFKNLYGLLAVKVTDSNVTCVKLKSNKADERFATTRTVLGFSGEFYTVAAGDNYVDEITLTPSEGSFTTGETYYMVVPPMTFTEGACFSLYNGNTLLGQKSTSGAVSVDRNKVHSVPALTLGEAPADEEANGTFDFPKLGYENAETIVIIESGDVTLMADKGSNSNAPKYYNTGSAGRFYGGNTITLSSKKAIKKVEFTFGADDGTNNIIVGGADSGSVLESNIWTGSSDNLVFTIDGTTGNRRIVTILVGEGSESEPTVLKQVAAPVFNPEAGAVESGTKVSITSATEGASIYYSLTEAEPQTLYSEPIEITEAVTVKAVARKDGMLSSTVSSATYTIKEGVEYTDFSTVAELNAKVTSTSATYNGKLSNAVVSFVPSTSVAIIKDATGSITYYKSGHGLKQGQSFSGNLTVTALLYNGLYSEITKSDAIFTGDETSVEPETVTLSALSGNYATYQNAYVKVSGLEVTAVDKKNISVTDGTVNYIVYTNDSNADNKVGQVITVVGTVTKYGDTEEIKVWKKATGISVDKDVFAPATIDATDITGVGAAGVTDAVKTITINNGEGWTPSVTCDGSVVTAASLSENTITYSVAANTGAARDGSITVTLTMSGQDDVVKAIKVSQLAAGSTEPQTIIIDGSQLTSTPTTEATELEYSGLTIVFSSGAKQFSSAGENKFTSDAILIGKADAYIYNKTAIPGKITKFEIYANKGASAKVSVGVNFSSDAINAYSAEAANTYTATLSTLDSVYDCSDKLPEGCKYFWYQVTNSNNSQVQFRITYIPE